MFHPILVIFKLRNGLERDENGLKAVDTTFCGFGGGFFVSP